MATRITRLDFVRTYSPNAPVNPMGTRKSSGRARERLNSLDNLCKLSMGIHSVSVVRNRSPAPGLLHRYSTRRVNEGVWGNTSKEVYKMKSTP